MHFYADTEVVTPLLSSPLLTCFTLSIMRRWVGTVALRFWTSVTSVQYMKRWTVPLVDLKWSMVDLRARSRAIHPLKPRREGPPFQSCTLRGVCCLGSVYYNVLSLAAVVWWNGHITGTMPACIVFTNGPSAILPSGTFYAGLVRNIDAYEIV